jgi:hypothetical protein
MTVEACGYITRTVSSISAICFVERGIPRFLRIDLRRTQAKVTVTRDAVLPRLSEVALGRTRQMTGSLRGCFSSRTRRAKTQ